MIHKKIPVSSRIAVQKPQEAVRIQTSSSDQSSIMLAMLEALAAAMDAKAEVLLESDKDERTELRAQFLADVADAIRAKFEVP